MEKAKKEKQLNFRTGLIDGIPIALGYLSVSFGFGILCMRLGLNILQAVGISATNVTSAGQVAGVGIIAAAGTLIEMILTQFVINVRYSLMAISLSRSWTGHSPRRSGCFFPSASRTRSLPWPIPRNP